MYRRAVLAAGLSLVAGCGGSSADGGATTGRSTGAAAPGRHGDGRATPGPAPLDVRYAVGLGDGATVRVTAVLSRPGGGPAVPVGRSDPSGYELRRVETEGLTETADGWRLPVGAETARATFVLARPAATRYDTVTETWALVARPTVRALLAVEREALGSRSVAIDGPGYAGTDALLAGAHERTCLVADDSTVTVVAAPSPDRPRRPGAVRGGVESVRAARRTLGLDAGDVNVFSLPGYEVEIEGERRGLALGDTDFLFAADETVRFGYFGEDLADHPPFEPADDLSLRPELFGMYLSLLHDRNERDGYDEREYLRRLAQFDPDADVPGVPEMAALDATLRDATDGRRWLLDVLYGLNALSDHPHSPRVTARSRLPFVASVSRADFERLVAAIAGRERDGWFADRFWPGAVDPTVEPGLADLGFRYPSSRLDEIEQTWVHEYVHLTQRLSVAPEMAWFVEASANYLAGLYQLYEGTVRFGAFYERYDRDLDGPAPVDRGPLGGYAVDRVLCGLDAEIRRASGDRTLLAVVRAANDHDGRIDRGTFAALVADAAGTSLDGWLDRHLTRSPAAEIPNEPALFTDRDRFDLGLPRALGAGTYGCDGG